MTYFYSDSERGTASLVPYHKQNAVKSYLRHYDNLLFLQFVSRSSDNALERLDVLKEMEICQRKLKHWTHHANYDQVQALRGVNELKRNWSK